MGKYEDAKATATSVRKEEQTKAAEALAAQEEEFQRKEEAWQRERAQLVHAIEEARSETQDRMESFKTAKDQQESAVQAALLVPTAKCASLEEKLATVQVTLKRTQKELEQTNADLKAMTISRDSTETKLHASEELLVHERATAQARHAEIVKSLHAARSASEHGKKLKSPSNRYLIGACIHSSPS